MSIKSKKREKLLYYYSFFQAFPVVAIVVNLTFYFFPGLFLSYRKLQKLKVNHYFQFVAVLFGIGALISTIDSHNIKRSLVVLPNYLYWTFIIIFFYNYRKHINFDIVSKAIHKGIIYLNVYYWVIERFVQIQFPGIKYLGENGYAVLMICFVPLVLKRIELKKGIRTAIIYGAIFIVLGFLSGSRAGSVLVAVGAFLTLAGNRLNARRLILIGITGLAAYWAVYNAAIIKLAIGALSEETSTLIYDTQEVVETDGSYLLRKAMVEKGLILFEEEPLTGLGLNNWSEHEVEFRGDFVGAERIIYKSRLEKFSAHNSYISFLGEGGLLVFIPFVLILLITLLTLLRQYSKLDDSQRPILWGLLMMSIHIYFISAMLNSFTWFFIAIGGAAAFKNK